MLNGLNHNYLRQTDGSLVTITAPTDSSQTWDLNDNGTVLGFYYTGSDFHAFLWDATNGAKDITPDGIEVDTPIALNNLNQAIGWAYEPDGTPDSFFYDGTQWHDVADNA